MKLNNFFEKKKYLYKSANGAKLEDRTITILGNKLIQ